MTDQPDVHREPTEWDGIRNLLFIILGLVGVGMFLFAMAWAISTL